MSFLSMLQMAKGKDPPPPSERRNIPNSQQQPQSIGTTSAKQGTPSLAVSATGPLYGSSTAAEYRDRKPNTSVSPKLLQPKFTAPLTSSSASKVQKTQIQSANKIARPNETAAVRMKAQKRTEPKEVGVSGGVSKKRLSFKDVMKQAASIDKSKLEINLRVTKKPPQPVQRPSSRLRQRTKTPSPDNESVSQATREKKLSPASQKSRDASQKAMPLRAPSRNQPAPVAQPFPELLEKYKNKKTQKARPTASRDSDDDLSDFVVSEEEDDGYTSQRESIWSLYNRNPRSASVEDFSDDEMEATGKDILDEERRSYAQARREDIEEERKLEELARKKSQRKGKLR